ncbi:conserved hypothetical protein [Segniliparus rotundus DSM 44985]|uniref:SGNH hydrolase-type esterase domain-containing protein n=1 Tax=Segniliparus rotundus (strain ATCC BAA-972 / CDC 1076 / CIP 108378 / DSM 44985 / JCM 13578) TaxID=640132 RepID=D6ZEV8_SEGRD|nr:diglucosylglycerate octanoyltransferase [Segniliparus rotundus]ADG97482.1 conserved hypothetical protein [Segniliparus rotundus DSM 44985]
MSKTRQTLLVLADSLAYYGPNGALASDDPRIWPNLVAAELGWQLELVAQIGWTSREAYWALMKDPRAWAALPKAGALVIAVCGMDSLPSPLPTALRESMRYIRPPRLRRRVREAYQWAQPKLAPIGWPIALPAGLTVHYQERIRSSVAALRPDLQVVATLPSVHCAPSYARAHRGRPKTAAALSDWARSHRLRVVDLKAAVEEHVFAGRGNPDGIHWGFEGHERVAAAMLRALRGEQPPETALAGGA